MYAWYLGEEGGNALAEIIFGDANPSGKLPFTIPRSTDQLPDYKNYSMKNRTYRYLQYTPMYPFGFGLSYSQFKYSNLNFSDDFFQIGNSMIASLQVENYSDKEAEEVIQMYITLPESDYINPKFTLKQFKRVFLGPGEKKIISFSLSTKMLESFDINGNSKIEKGTYKITVGNSSPGNRSKELGAKLISADLDAI